MLKCNTIRVKWTKYNKDYYTSKGYIFTGCGNEFIVNVNDLSLKGNDKVPLVCDRCGVDMSWAYNVYVSNMESWKGTYCRECKKIPRTGYPTINLLYDYYFRQNIKPWYYDSLKACNSRCVISNKQTTLVHHKYSLKRIIYETLQSFGIPDKDMNSDSVYNSCDLPAMAKKCLELHYKYGLGVCLTKELHHEFHSIYGNGNCTPEQFEEFRILKLGGKAIYANQ
jgi:hypothetical protein